MGNIVTSQQGHWFESWLFEFACSSCVGISVSFKLAELCHDLKEISDTRLI